MGQFTLFDWMHADGVPVSYGKEVLDEAEALMEALHAFCAKHEIQLVTVMQTDATNLGHRLVGHQYLEDPKKVPPELLVCSAMLTNGLANSWDLMQTIWEASGERYSRNQKPQLKLVKSDD